mgnify:CR=1 FL=1
MLTHQLPKNNQLFSIIFTNYSKRHFLKDFEKKYEGKQWDYTLKSIIQDLSRLRMENNTTQLSQQIDELKCIDNEYIAKYDFKIAQTNVSTKSSGNRCIIYINNEKHIIEILMIYNKTHLPKNKDETKYIMDEIKNNFDDKYRKLLII